MSTGTPNYMRDIDRDICVSDMRDIDRDICVSVVTDFWRHGTPLSVVVSPMWFLERFSTIPVSKNIDRKEMELKLTGITLNRSKNHIGETITDKGVQVGFFY